MKTTEIIFRPNAGPQTDFLAAPEREVNFGGAAGGGKTYALLADTLRPVNNGAYTGIIFRRTNDELREVIQKSYEMYTAAVPGARFRVRDSEWRFPSGARIWFTYLEQDKDVHRYQGQEFQKISFDEVTQYATPFAWDYMRSRLRSADPTLRLEMRCTCNPGGPGMQWVKKMFVSPAPWGEPFWATNIETGEILRYPPGHTKEGQPLFQRRFIPSRLSDNPYLAESGDYETMLLSLPEDQKRKLLYGDWDVNEGAAFPEWNRNIHVVKPFHIPDHWRRFRAGDYGYSSHSGILWFAVHPSGQLIVYREMYVKGVVARQLGEDIVNAELEESLQYGVLDSSLWHKRGDNGPSLAAQMLSAGCKWRPSDRSAGSRVAGKNEIHRRLQVDTMTEAPGLVVFDTCTNLIEQMPAIPLDKSNPEDVDTKSNDHLYDALRYGLMSRPRPRSPFEFGMNNDYRKPVVDTVFGY